MDNGSKSHDSAYKQFFSHPEMVASLLRDFVPEDFIAELDFSTLERCSGSYVTDDLRERMDDVIWRVRWKGSWCYLFLLIEFQSRPDRWMAVRILAYTALLWQDLIKTGALAEDDSLPPVFPIVIYNGSRVWTAAQDVTALLASEAGRLADYQPRQRYFLLDESRVPEEVLARGGGIAAQLLRLERAQGPEDVQRVVKGLLKQLYAPEYTHLRRAFAVWLGRVVLKRSGITREIPEFQDLQEVDVMLEERAAQWGEEYRRLGMLAGLEEGLEKGLEKGIGIGEARGIGIGEARGIGLSLAGLLEERFGALPESFSSAIAGSTNTEALLRLIRYAYKADSLQAFTERMRQELSAQ